MTNLTIRPEEHRDYKSIISLILRSFSEGTDYSDGTDIRQHRTITVCRLYRTLACIFSVSSFPLEYASLPWETPSCTNFA